MNKDAFCELYGYSIRNKILGFILCCQETDFAASDVLVWDRISKPKVYEWFEKFEKLGYIKRSRVVGKTQLYRLDREHPHIKLLLKSMDMCLKLVVESHRKKSKSSSHSGTASVGAASAKHG